MKICAMWRMPHHYINVARKPDIFCFTETWISRFEPKFNDYVATWKHRVEPVGGIGIIFKKNIQHEIVTFDPISKWKT